MENSTPKTLQVSHSFPQPLLLLVTIYKEEAKTKTKAEEKTFIFRKGLDIHIAVDRAGEFTQPSPHQGWCETRFRRTN